MPHKEDTQYYFQLNHVSTLSGKTKSNVKQLATSCGALWLKVVQCSCFLAPFQFVKIFF